MIDQYKQAFQEEARELLSELESALLELDQRRDDQEVVGRAFRALHTIKGSGAMFGFDDIAGFTHHLENTFDQLRNGQLAVTADLIRLALGAGDQIKAMLEEAAGRGAADQGRSIEILAAVRQLTGDVEPEKKAAPVPALKPTVAEDGPAREWGIRFRPGPDVLLNGTNPLLLLTELRGLGELRIAVDTAGVPQLSEMDPERCYLAWDVVLTTTAYSGRDPGCLHLRRGRLRARLNPSRLRLWERLRLQQRPSRTSRGGRSRRVPEPPPSAYRPTSWISWSTWSAN